MRTLIPVPYSDLYVPGGGLPQSTPKKKRGERNQAVDLDSRAGAGAATTAANDAGAGASAATGENFGAAGLGAAGRGAAAVPPFRLPRALPPRPRPAPAAGFRARGFMLMPTA